MSALGLVTVAGFVLFDFWTGGLAGAGVTCWWLLVPAVGAVPLVVVGLRMIQRNRAEAAAA